MMSFSNFLFIFSVLILIVKSNPISEQKHHVYNLICSNNKPDCDLVESVPNHEEFEVNNSTIII